MEREGMNQKGAASYYRYHFVVKLINKICLLRMSPNSIFIAAQMDQKAMNSVERLPCKVHIVCLVEEEI